MCFAFDLGKRMQLSDFRITHEFVIISCAKCTYDIQRTKFPVSLEVIELTLRSGSRKATPFLSGETRGVLQAILVKAQRLTPCLWRRQIPCICWS